MRITDYIQRDDLGGDMATLADDIGLEAVRTLYSEWRGCSMTIPTRIPRRSQLRVIASALEAGKQVREIARELNVSERHVQHLIHTQLRHVNPQQMELLPQTPLEGEHDA